MKFWLIALLGLSTYAGAETENTRETTQTTEETQSWIDSSHTYASDSAQALTEWLDAYFGDPLYDAERAESFLRLEVLNDWDQEDGNSVKLRLRGQVQLPKISQRVHLVFRGEESDSLDADEQEEEDSVGLQYQVLEGGRSRLDVTLSYASSHLKPGIRYRNEGAFSDLYSYRLTQRLQYEDGEKFFSTTLADLNRAVGGNAAWRWSNRLLYGEETEGAEWRTRFSLRQRLREGSERPLAMSYFSTISGVTRPDSFVKNYKLGVLFRRQFFRDFLFFEFEPAYNWRRREFELEREGQWSAVVRVEIALQRDLNARKSSSKN